MGMQWQGLVVADGRFAVKLADTNFCPPVEALCVEPCGPKLSSSPAVVGVSLLSSENRSLGPEGPGEPHSIPSLWRPRSRCRS